MSSVKVQGHANGTGTFTIAAPNSNVDRTLTLPDSAGTLLNDQSNITTQVKSALNASGDAPIYGCRAWVNFDGSKDSTGAASTANTARLIRASGNVSSVTRTGTGNYTVNFASAMPDTNYILVGTVGGTINNRLVWTADDVTPRTTGAVALSVVGTSMTTAQDSAIVQCAIFR